MPFHRGFAGAVKAPRHRRSSDGAYVRTRVRNDSTLATTIRSKSKIHHRRDNSSILQTADVSICQPSAGRRIGYIRVSTSEQSPDRQIDGLKSLCDELHVEIGVSAVAKQRPVFEQVIKRLGKGDSLVVWNLDRAFRSSVDAIQTADSLKAKGVNLHIVSMSMDTSTPEGRFVYTIMAGLAELERATLARRTREGLAATRRRGTRLGRPRVLSESDIRSARMLLCRPNATMKSVAEALCCHPRTLARALGAFVSREGGLE